MRPRKISTAWAAFAAVLAALILAAGNPLAAAQDKPAGTPMTLDRCLLQAMEKNLGLRIQVLEPRKAEFAITGAAERFLPTLSFQRTLQSQISPSYSFLDAGEQYTDDYNRYGGGVSLFLPTGATVSTRSVAAWKRTLCRFSRSRA